MTCLDARRLIDPYLDEELPPAEAAAVRMHVEACNACERAVETRLAVQRAVRQGPYYTAPNRVRAALAASAASAASTTRARVRMARVAWASAAVVALLAIGAAAARVVQTRRATDAIATATVMDHIQALRSQSLIEVRSSDQHTVKPWFLGKLDFAPPVQDLASAGFPLDGGRLARIDGRAVAVVVYHRRQHPITVFIWPEADARSAVSDARTVRGFNVRHWTSGGMAFWAVTDASAADLEELVNVMRGA